MSASDSSGVGAAMKTSGAVTNAWRGARPGALLATLLAVPWVVAPTLRAGPDVSLVASLVLWASGALVLLLALGAVRALDASEWRPWIWAATGALLPTAALGGVLNAATHHRPLGAVVYAIGVFVTWGFTSTVALRLHRLVAGGRAWARVVGHGLAAASILGVAVLAATARMSSAAESEGPASGLATDSSGAAGTVVDALVLIVLLAVAPRVARRLPAHRTVSTALVAALLGLLVVLGYGTAHDALGGAPLHYPPVLFRR